MTNEISIHAFKILGYIKSFRFINNLCLLLNDDMENLQNFQNKDKCYLSECPQYSVDSYYIYAIKDMERSLYLLSTLIRPILEKIEIYEDNIDRFIRYGTVGQVEDECNRTLTFKQAVNRIMHKQKIRFEIKDDNENTYLSYNGQDIKNSNLTIYAYVTSKEKDSKEETVMKLNLLQFCSNALSLVAVANCGYYI